jgi:TonB family protein
MASSDNDRVLRVAVIQAGRIVEERHLRSSGQFTVGQDARNSFVVANVQVPASVPLFERRGNQHFLLLTDETQGRVRLETEDIDFETVRSQELAKKKGKLYTLPLPDTAKGTVTWGDVTVLFQVVQWIEPEKVAIDPTFHRPWYRAREPLFMGILGVSIFLHLSAATALFLTPKPADVELSLDELPDRFAKMMMPPKVPVPEKPKEAVVVETKDDKKDKPKEETKRVEKVASADPVQHKAAIQQKVASKGLLKILGSNGGGGAFQDVLGNSTGSGDIASALAGAGGVGVATSDTVGAGGPKGGGAGKVAGIGDVGTSGGGHVNLGKGDVAVAGRVKDIAPEVDSPNVDREALARYVKARLKAIQNCYEKELKRTPSLKGKVVVRFNISRSGRAADIEIEENSLGNEAVGACIRTVIRGWIFPFKPEDDVPVAYPFVFSPAS